MDVGDLLTRARRSAALSQRALAREAGTSRAMLSAYETGAKSPTVRQLDLLLAACGLQLRPALEPLLAHVDERVDAMLRDPVDMHAEALQRVGDSLDTGVGWAADGATALALQGLAVAHARPCVAVRHDPALQQWLRAVMAKGYDEQGRFYWGSWLEADLQTAQDHLGAGVFTTAGTMTIRVVAELPAVLQVALEVPGPLLDPFSDDDDGPREPSTRRVVPTVPAYEVEASHPALAEQLARWRYRQEHG